MTIGKKIIKGAGWRALGRVSNQIFQLVVSVVLARLLSPSAFGLVAMVSVFIGFAGLFNEFGLTAAIIQRKDIEERHASTAFWMNTAAGLAIAVVFVLGSSAISAFYEEPSLQEIIPVMALVFVVGPLSLVHYALLNRNMDFRTLTYAEVLTSFSAGSFGIGLALAGFGVWSLVLSSLFGRLVSTAFFWWAHRWRPKLLFDLSALRDLLGFGIGVTANNFVVYFANSADRLLIGKFMSPHSVGLYGRSYAFMLVPFRQITWVLTSVLFPALSSIQEDRERIRAIFKRMMGMVSFVAFPILCGMAVVAEPLVLALLGAKWAGAIPVVRILCFVGIFQTVTNLHGPLLQSLGFVNVLFRLSVIQSIVQIIAISVGVMTGQLENVAYGVLMASAVILYPYLRAAKKFVGINPVDSLKSMSGSFVCSVLMAGSIVLLDRFYIPEWSQWQVLMIETAFGTIVYLLLSSWFKNDALSITAELIRERLSI